MLKITAVLCLVMSTVEVMAQVNPVVAAAAAAAAGLRNPHPLGLTPSAGAVTLHKENENDGSGNFHYSFETSDGIRQEQTGIQKGADPLNPEGVQAVQGSYSYISPEGVNVAVSYIADENGYRVVNNNQHVGHAGQFFNRNNFNSRIVDPVLRNQFGVDPLLRNPNLGVDPLLRHPNLGLGLGVAGLRPGNPAHAALLERELLLRQQQQPFNRFAQRNPYNFNDRFNQNRFFPGNNYNGAFGGGFGDRFFL